MHLFPTDVSFEMGLILNSLGVELGQKCWELPGAWAQPLPAQSLRLWLTPLSLSLCPVPRGGGAVSGRVIPGGHPGLHQQGAGPAPPHRH